MAYPWRDMIVAGVEIIGTKQLDLSRSGWHKLRERLQANGADLPLGWPLESQTLCRFKEVVRDVMSEKGFLDVEISLDTRADLGKSPAPDAQVHDCRGTAIPPNGPGCATAVPLRNAA